MELSKYDEERYEKLLQTNFKINPCPKCGGEGREMVGDGYPFTICGIPVATTIGNIIICTKCGFRSGAHREPWKAIADWNNIKPEKESNNAKIRTEYYSVL